MKVYQQTEPGPLVAGPQEPPLRYYRTTGLTTAQTLELVLMVAARLDEPWDKPTGRPRACTLYRAVEISCMYLRHNATQEFLGDLRDLSQPTVSRIISTIVPIVELVLAQYVPTEDEAVARAKRHVVLVDGTITPCWSYAEHNELWSRKHATTGFNAQLVCLLDGEAIYISDPLPGNTHDATAYTTTPVAHIVQSSGGGIADKGYQGTDCATPVKKPRGGQLSRMQKKCNTNLSKLRAPIERLVAHFKAWRILHTDYRRPYNTYRQAYDAARGLFFFSLDWGFE